MTNQQFTPHSPPSFLRRIPLAISAFFNILFNGEFAGRFQDFLQYGAQVAPPQPVLIAAPVPVAPAPVAPILQLAPTTSAMQLLALFQRDARLVDFTQENLSAYADADIGAAARLVHEGCRKVLAEHFTIEPIRAEQEGNRITLQAGFDAGAIRLTGNVVGKPPFNGTLSHRGWRTTDVRLPKLTESHDVSVLAPAEVEL